MVYDFVFVVLVYRNTQDLDDFFKSFTLDNSKVIIVNSFYDKISEQRFKDLARMNNADFISVANKGYGYGNNKGCEYAIANYDFKYLVISNADIIVKKMSVYMLRDNSIIAPNIINLTGKKQNPFMPYYFPLFDKIKYIAFRKNCKIIIFIFCIISRLIRNFYFLFPSRKIYACHGSFVIFPIFILKRLFPIYNEKMFLFVEEEHLAQLAMKNNINIIYNPQIKILHKEDGSVGFINNHFEITRKSFIEFFKYWYL